MNFKEMKDRIFKMQDSDYDGFVKALISIEKGINNEEVLDKLYSRYMDQDSMGLLDENFDYMIDEMRDEGIVVESMETEERTNRDNELFEKMDDFINSYIDLSNAMYKVDYDFADGYPLEKSFDDIDFIGWVEASKTNLSEIEKGMDDGRYGNEYKNLKDLFSKESEIQSLQEELDRIRDEIKERRLDKHFSDSWEYSAQISKDIDTLKDKVAVIEEKINKITNTKDNKKESTIAKLNKLKDKVSKDAMEKSQEKIGVTKNNREM